VELYRLRVAGCDVGRDLGGGKALVDGAMDNFFDISDGVENTC
jgi:hypothetical protein